MPAKSPRLPAGLTVAQWYPNQVEQLVTSHRKMPDHRLELAIWFDMDHRKDVHLLEVLDGFPRNDEPSKLYTSEFESTFTFPMPTGGKLILVMTSPQELEEALAKRYPQAKRMQKAFARNAARVLYRAPSNKIKKLTEELQRGR